MGSFFKGVLKRGLGVRDWRFLSQGCVFRVLGMSDFLLLSKLYFAAPSVDETPLSSSRGLGLGQGWG